MSTPVLWSCEVSGQEGLTVGSVFAIKCSGTLDVSLNPQIGLELPEGVDKYALKILSFKQDSGRSLELNVTSYLPGEHKLKFIRIGDGERSIESGELNFTVASVLAQDSQPIPPFAPGSLPFPQSLIFGALFFVLVVVLGVGALIFKQRQRRRLAQELKEYESNLNPKDQFEKSLRRVRHSLNWTENLKQEEAQLKMEELSRALRVFLMRQYRVSTLKAKPEKLLSLIKADVEAHDLGGWRALLGELSVERGPQGGWQKDSIVQLLDQSQRLVGRL